MARRRPSRTVAGAGIAALIAGTVATLGFGPAVALPGDFTGAHPVQGVDHVRTPAAVATDPAGTHVYVVDTGHDVVLEFGGGITGSLLLAFGAGGSGPGQLAAPAGVAADGSSNVYVADSGNNRIEVFSAAGTFVTSYGGAGSAAGQFSDPTGIAVSASGDLYVADTGNNRVQHRDPSGTWNVVGPATAPRGVAVDNVGVVYVADTGANRIATMASDGTILNSWTGGASPLAAPSAVVLDGTGSVFVADTGHSRVVQYTTGGVQQNAWGSAGSGDLGFQGPTGLAISGSDAYVADTGNDRVQQLLLRLPVQGPPAVQSTVDLPPRPTAAGVTWTSRFVGTTIDGDLFSGDDGRNGLAVGCGVSRFDHTGALKQRISSVEGTGPGQMQWCIHEGPGDGDTALASNGDYVVSDSARLEVFDGSAAFVRDIAVGPEGVVIDSSDHLWTVSSAATSTVTELSLNGSVLVSWGMRTGTTSSSMALDPTTGDVIAVALTTVTGTWSLDRYTSSGALLSSTPLAVTGGTVTVDPLGHVLVAGGTQVHWYDSTGSEVVHWTAPSPTSDIATDSLGRIYVGAIGSGVVTIYDPLPPPTPQPPSFVRSLATGGLGGGVSRVGLTQQVVTAPDGSTTIAWQALEGTKFRMYAATRPAGSAVFGSPVALEAVAAAQSFGESPAIAASADGSVTVAWEVYDGSMFAVHAATRLTGASAFGPPVVVQGAVSVQDESPRIAGGPGGSSTIVWNVKSGTSSVVWVASRPGSTGAFVTRQLSGASPVATRLWPQVATGSSGGTAVTWNEQVGATFATWVAWRAPGATAFSAPQNLEPTPVTAVGYELPQVAVGGDGTATVVWQRMAPDQRFRVYAATRSPGASSFGPPMQVEGEVIASVLRTGNDEAPQVVAAPDGTTTVAWDLGEGQSFHVWQATRPPGQSTFGQPTRVGSLPASTFQIQPAVAAGPGGYTVITWAGGEDFTHWTVFAATRTSAFGAFGTRVALSATNSDVVGPAPQVAVAPDASTTVVWEHADSTLFGSPITVWENSTPLAAPLVRAAARLASTPMVGTPVTCSVSLTNAAASTTAWRRDSAVIAKATARTYRPVAADLGHLLRCAVTATNPLGTVTTTGAGVRVLPALGPSVVLTRHATVKISSAGAVAVTARCPVTAKAGCATTFVLRTPGKVTVGATTAVVTLGSLRATIPRGALRTLALPLSAAGRAAVRAHPTLAVLLTATTTTRGFTPAAARIAFTLTR